jgi:apolipoprotein N-acyltransferase
LGSKHHAVDGAADLLILPVNDWKSIRIAYFQMHAFRAIETGIPIVRAAADGISGAFRTIYDGPIKDRTDLSGSTTREEVRCSAGTRASSLDVPWGR